MAETMSYRYSVKGMVCLHLESVKMFEKCNNGEYLAKGYRASKGVCYIKLGLAFILRH